MDVKYKGRASHAAGFPWEGVNALDAAVMAYNNVSVLRQQMKPSWRVHGVYDRALLLQSFMVQEELMANHTLLVLNVCIISNVKMYSFTNFFKCILLYGLSATQKY